MKDFYIILHNIRSAYNVGSILRTADGIGVKKAYLCGYTPCPHDGKRLYKSQAEKMLEKTSLGAEKMVVWEKQENIQELLQKMRNEKIKILALEQSPGSVEYKKFMPKFPLALILGNEPTGIENNLLVQCDSVLEIPMRGSKNSLNVSVAFGIAGYEIMSKT